MKVTGSSRILDVVFLVALVVIAALYFHLFRTDPASSFVNPGTVCETGPGC